jgi:hypothetical protein
LKASLGYLARPCFKKKKTKNKTKPKKKKKIFSKRKIGITAESQSSSGIRLLLKQQC